MTEESPAKRDLASFRVILEGAILAVIIWSANAQISLQTQVAVLQDNVVQLRALLSDVPGMSRSVSKIEVRMDNSERDIRELRQLRGVK